MICDNLPEILARRPDAIISAQFFWHDVIEGASTDYAEYCEQLLDRHKPKVMGCELFAMDAVRRQPGFQPVGSYQIPELVAAAKATPMEQRTDLLVTGGTSPAVREQLRELIDDLLQNGPGEYRRVHVDPELLPENAPAWIVRADFSIDMYCRLKVAVCRPGLGVVTDLMTVDAQIDSVYEAGNHELKHNFKILSVRLIEG